MLCSFSEWLFHLWVFAGCRILNVAFASQTTSGGLEESRGSRIRNGMILWKINIWGESYITYWDICVFSWVCNGLLSCDLLILTVILSCLINYYWIFHLATWLAIHCFEMCDCHVEYMIYHTCLRIPYII